MKRFRQQNFPIFRRNNVNREQQSEQSLIAIHGATHATTTMTHESLHSLVYGDEDFLVQALQAAQQGTSGTVRRVLRAVAVHALPQQLQRSSDNAESRIVITQADIVAVQTYCRQLAQRWSAANTAIGHVQLAACISDVVERENDTLYFGEMETSDKEDDPDNLEDEPDLRATANSTASSLSNAVTVQGRLGSLPRQTLGDAIQTLDHLGSRHATYWTGSWRTIQGFAKQIPYRLYKNNVPQQIELVPAGVAGTEARTAADWLLDRKRKSAGRERLPPKRVKTVAVAAAPPPLPRPASTLDEQKWTLDDVIQSLSVADRTALDAQVLSNAASESPPSLVVGALMDLGHYHHAQQSAIDYDTPERSQQFSRLDMKRRHQRRSTLERLANHVRDSTDYGAAAKRAASSRTAQTRSANHQQWRDLDLQHVVLEVFDGEQRHVLALESLEVFLLDEDEAPPGWHDQET